MFLISLNCQTGQLTLMTWICRLFNLQCSSADGFSSEVQKHWLSETSPEQLLGHDQPRTNQRYFGELSERPLVVTWCTQWTLFVLILWFLLVANYFCHKLHWNCRRYWRFFSTSLTRRYIIYEDYGETVILRLMVIKLRCTKLCVVFFLEHPVRMCLNNNTITVNTHHTRHEQTCTHNIIATCLFMIKY